MARDRAHKEEEMLPGRNGAGHVPADLLASSALFFLTFCMVSVFGPRLAQAYEWSITTIPQSPKAQQMHSAIYDSANNRMVVCCQPDLDGQTNDVYVLDLDTFDGSWSPLLPIGTAPSRRYDHTTIYDAANERMILFGGMDSVTLYTDIYALELSPGAEAWAELSPAGAPPSPRMGHASMYDPPNQRMIVFCGEDTSGLLNDVHSLDLTSGNETWTQLSPSGQPPRPRIWSSALYDPINHRMVVFGGDTSHVAGGTNDVWALDLTIGNESWTELTPSGTPPSPRCDHTATYDPVNHRMMVYAGFPPNQDLFALDLISGNETWSQLSPGGDSRTPEFGHEAIYDPFRRRMLVSGGDWSDSYLSYTYSLDLTSGAETWTRLYPEHEAPITRDGGPSAIYDPEGQQMVIFGGRTGGWQDLVNDVSILSLNAGSEEWRPVPPSGTVPPPTAWSAEVYDPVSRRMVIFAGDLNSNDVYVFDLASETWDELSPSGAIPPATRCHTGAYDLINHRMVVFGGYGAATGDNRTWALDLSSGAETWYLLDPAGTPPIWRANQSAIYNPINHAMLIYGGGDIINGYPDDVWALDLTLGSEAWFEIHPGGTPPSPRGSHSAVYDLVNHKMIVFAGEYCLIDLDDVYTLDLTSGSESWEQIFPGGVQPPAMSHHSAIYDSLTHRMIIWGGSIADRHAYSLRLPTGVDEDASYTWSPITHCKLFQNRPNPFSHTTTIHYRLPPRRGALNHAVQGGDGERGRGGEEWQIRDHTSHITLTIYDLGGRLVRRLVDSEPVSNFGFSSPGGFASGEPVCVVWDGRDDGGTRVRAGVYFYRLEAGEFTATNKMVVLR